MHIWWDIFDNRERTSPFRHFTITKNISRLNVRHSFQASYPKLDSRSTTAGSKNPGWGVCLLSMERNVIVKKRAKRYIQEATNNVETKNKVNRLRTFKAKLLDIWKLKRRCRYIMSGLLGRYESCHSKIYINISYISKVLFLAKIAGKMTRQQLDREGARLGDLDFLI